VPSLPGTFAEDVINQPARALFEAFLDEHRGELNRCLDELTEEKARQSLVPSRTTLLGLGCGLVLRVAGLGGVVHSP
jgi:hypothetical protein